MDLNLALNTILYVMLFLFPGILFRKFYFIGEHYKQFHNGNLLERFLWTILLSIVMIVLTILAFTLAQKSGMNYPYSLSYSSIQELFSILSENKLPTVVNSDQLLEENIETINKSELVDLAISLFSLYFMSLVFGIVGFLLNNKILPNNPIFKFSNYWSKIIKGQHKNNNIDTIVRAYTIADILTCDDQKLYTGKVVDYYLNNDNNLETIILTDTYRYKKLKYRVIKKKIPGDNFCIKNDKIQNVNFTYVYQEKSENSFYKKISIAISVIALILIVFLATFIFSDLLSFGLNSFWKKLVFFVSGGIFTIAFLGSIELIITKQFSKFSLDMLLILILFSIAPFGWVFGFLNWLATLGIMLFIFVILNVIEYNRKEKRRKKKQS